jgi:poly(hydroxyalkanoate) depolymerase family esterase
MGLKPVMKLLTALVLSLISVTSVHAALTPTTTTISSSKNPSGYGQSVTFTAVVSSKSGTPPNGENVNFLQGQKLLGSGTLHSGSATFAIATLTTGGADNIKAEYTGDATYAASTSIAVVQVVNKASTGTSLVSSLNPANSGQSVTFTATVTPQFSGTVTGVVAFNNGSVKLGTAALSNGIANYTTTKLTAGTHAITATYNGSGSFLTSTSNTVNQTVSEGTFTDSTMLWDGVTRYYEVYVPANLPASPPMVLMLHGTKTTPTADSQAVITQNWGWQAVADVYGFILVKPASTYNATSHQWNWNAYFMDAAFPSPAPDDSGFLRQLIVNLTAQYNVNPTMVYVAGFSSGAQMTERVGVEISDLVAAIVPASGQLVGQQVPPPGLPGNALSPISVQEWAGTKDTTLWPCNYGTTKYSGVTFTLDTVDDTFNYWKGQNSCTVLQTKQTLCLNGEPNNANDAPTPGMTGLTGNIASSCADSTQVQFIWEPNVGHSFQQQYDEQRWLFFAANPMSPKRRK